MSFCSHWRSVGWADCTVSYYSPNNPITIRGHPAGRSGRNYLPKLSHFSFFQAQWEVVLHSIYRKNIPKDFHFSSKLQNTVKTFPWLKFLGLPLNNDNDNKNNNNDNQSSDNNSSTFSFFFCETVKPKTNNIKLYFYM